jgi:hypothetical protein
MVIHTRGVASSVADDDYEGMAYIYCVDASGYCLSLSRQPDAALIEVMVVDQVVHRTAEVAAELHPDMLVIGLSPSAAASLDGIVAYVVPLSVDAEELRALDAALATIFAVVGRYDRWF